MPIAEISVIPVGTPTISISNYVAEAVKLVDRSGLKYRVSPMGTSVEGEIAVIFEVVRQMHETCFAKGAQRVVTTVILDDRRDKAATMESKIKSVSEKAGLEIG